MVKFKTISFSRILYSSIKNISICEKGFNYEILITCENETIKLTAQQKELSNIRTSGSVSMEDGWGTKNWHSKNLDSTLEKLESIWN